MIPNFIAHVTFLTKKEGGRESPVHSNYRPHLTFDDDTSELRESFTTIMKEVYNIPPRKYLPKPKNKDEQR